MGDTEMMQAVGIVGAVIILVAYGLVRTGRADANGPASSLLNAFGSALLCASAVATGFYAGILLNGVWFLLSFPSMIPRKRS